MITDWAEQVDDSARTPRSTRVPIKSSGWWSRNTCSSSISKTHLRLFLCWKLSHPYFARYSVFPRVRAPLCLRGSHRTDQCQSLRQRDGDSHPKGGAARTFERSVRVGLVDINATIPMPVALCSFGGGPPRHTVRVPLGRNCAVRSCTSAQERFGRDDGSTMRAWTLGRSKIDLSLLGHSLYTARRMSIRAAR